MDRFRSALSLAAALAILIPAGAVLAVTAHTIDTKETPLRASPAIRAKILVNIPPASSVEFVDYQAYAKVRYQKPDGQIQEGWVATRFLSEPPPGSPATKKLEEENETLRAQVGEVGKEKTELSQREKELTDKLTKLNAAYETLKEGSANYLKLKSENESAKASLTNAQENIQALVQENENIKVSQNIRWFLTGALVLFIGWFMGWATGKLRRKKKGTYYY